MQSFLAVFFLSACCTCALATGGVASNGRECAPIGRDILNAGGNAVDSAIAVLLCEGVTGPQSMGIGGGFLATIYIKNKSIKTTINAREAAPKNVVKIKGGNAFAIPSEIKGYWELKERFGNPDFKWEHIFEPTIKLCKEGYIVDRYLGKVLSIYEKEINAEPSLSEIFVNPKTNQVYKEGETAFRPQLGETLTKIAKNGAKEFYGGATGQDFINDVNDMGGSLTMQDLENYQITENVPLVDDIDYGFKLYTVPLPGSGVVLNEIIQLLKGWARGAPSATLIHRMAESMKHAYGLRSKLSDSDLEPAALQALIDKMRVDILKDDDKTHDDTSYYGDAYDHNDSGSSNVAVVDGDGNGIAVTSTINNVFGAFVRSGKTGIILNNEMDNVSTPGKRLISSLCPSIIIREDGTLRMVLGAAGGSQIPSSLAQVIYRIFFANQPMGDAINGLRIHHQLVPNKLMYEEGRINESDLKELREKGHDLQPEFVVNIPGFSAVTGVSVFTMTYPSGESKQILYPEYDRRRGGSSTTTDGLSSVFPSTLGDNN